MKTKISIILAALILICVSSCKKTAKLSSENKMLSFTITNLTKPAIGIINEAQKIVNVSVPSNADISVLVPNITISDKATISPIPGLAQNFSVPVTYTVTAENKSNTTYTVIVTKNDPSIETISGSMTANKTLPDLGLPIDYIIDGMLYLEGNALLTIEPGVKIIFTSVDGGITVGENAGLKMIGTADKPIIFRGPVNNTNKGSWNYIKYISKRADNVMEYVHLINGGATTNDYGVLQVYGSVSVKNCLIDGSLGAGIQVETYGDLKAYDGNSIKNCENHAMWINNAATLAMISANNIFTNNVKNYVRGVLSFNTNDLTLKAISVPFYIEDNAYVSKTLTIEAGAMLYFQHGSGLIIEESGKLIAEGTTSKHIVLRGLNDEAGYWNGIQLSSILSGNKLVFCDISGGGASDSWNQNHDIYLGSSAKISIQNCTFSKSNFYGVSLADKSSANFQLTHSGNSFASCNVGNVYDEASDAVMTNLP